MAEFTIAIQHTPHRDDRRRWVRRMLAQLRAEHPGASVTVVEDTHGEGCWSTYRRALEVAGDAHHHLMLQDDLGLCADFIRSVADVIRARPSNLIALYTNAKTAAAVRERGEAWLERPGACGPSVIWPRDLIAEFLEWQDRHIDDAFEFDTVRVSMWLLKTGRKAFATVPSLTEHLGCVSSTMGLNNPKKVATWYIGDDRSAVDIDWTKGLESPLSEATCLLPEWWAHCRD
jgi:hypothetical protein